MGGYGGPWDSHAQLLRGTLSLRASDGAQGDDGEPSQLQLQPGPRLLPRPGAPVRPEPGPRVRREPRTDVPSEPGPGIREARRALPRVRLRELRRDRGRGRDLLRRVRGLLRGPQGRRGDEGPPRDDL